MSLVISKNQLIRVDWNLSYHYKNEVIFRFSFLLIKSKRGFVFKRQNFTVSPSIHLPRNCCHICCKMLRKRTLLYQECLEYLLYFFLRCPCSGLVYKAVRWLQHSVLNPFHAPSSAQVFLCSPDASSRSKWSDQPVLSMLWWLDEFVLMGDYTVQETATQARKYLQNTHMCRVSPPTAVGWASLVYLLG